MCLSAICTLSLGQRFFVSFAHFLTESSVSCRASSFESSLHTGGRSLLSDALGKHFLPALLALNPFHKSFAELRFLTLIKSNVSLLPFIDSAFGVVIKHSSPQGEGPLTTAECGGSPGSPCGPHSHQGAPYGPMGIRVLASHSTFDPFWWGVREEGGRPWASLRPGERGLCCWGGVEGPSVFWCPLPQNRAIIM